MDMHGKLAEVPAHVPPECVIDWDFNNVEGADQDVHLAWKRLQQGPPVQWTPYYGGHWIVTRAPLVQELQKDYERFSHTVFSLPRRVAPPMPPIDLDPPEHTPYRQILNIAFAPSVINRLKTQIRELAIELTEAVKDAGACEFMADYARKFPVTVFLRLVDLPLERRTQFIAWGEQSVRGSTEDKMAIYPTVQNYLRSVVEERYQNPGNDVISQIASSQIGDRRVSRDEALGMTTLLFFGGLDTVASMLGFITRFLAEHPEHRQFLVENPERIPRAVEEFLRRHGLSNTVRLVTHDMEFHGCALKKDELVMVPISLAGMDEDYWDDAMNIDFSRDVRHIDTFGNGAHRCPGSNLARTEIATFLEEWLKRIPEFRIPAGQRAVTATGSVPGVIELPLEW